MIDELERQYGANTVREGGLKVYTTIDPRLQRNAVKAIRDILPYRTDPAAAIVSVEPGTGAIRAMTAVVRSAGNQFNLAAQSARQAGSTFKTFVLASAIEKGVDPGLDVLHLGAVHVLARAVVPGHAVAGAHLREHLQRHESLTRATLQSDNTVYAQLTLDVGPRYVWQLGAPARRAHVAEQAGRLDRARLARRLAARHGGGVRDVRRDGHLREADGDHEGDPAGRQGRQGQRLGQAADEARGLARVLRGR